MVKGHQTGCVQHGYLRSLIDGTTEAKKSTPQREWSAVAARADIKKASATVLAQRVDGDNDNINIAFFFLTSQSNHLFL